jgi:hypothetical protein
VALFGENRVTENGRVWFRMSIFLFFSPCRVFMSFINKISKKINLVIFMRVILISDLLNASVSSLARGRMDGAM